MKLDLSIGRPATRGGLTLYPVFTQMPAARPYLTGRQADSEAVLAITERPGAAAVPELLVENRGDLPVLLVEGETVLGGKQNRTLNVSVLCPPRTRTPVPVSCVEEGRWGAPQVTRRSPRHAPSRLRDLKTASVVAAAIRGDGKLSNQVGVWQEVTRHVQHRDLASPTSALEDVYAAADSELRHLVDGLRPRPGQVGVVAAEGRHIRVLDLFDRTESLADYWDGLVQGYALDVDGDHEGRRPTADQVLFFLHRVQRAHAQEVPPAGLGRELHLTSTSVHGTALLWDHAVVHLSAFNHGPWRKRMSAQVD